MYGKGFLGRLAENMQVRCVLDFVNASLNRRWGVSPRPEDTVQLAKVYHVSHGLSRPESCDKIKELSKRQIHWAGLAGWVR